VARHPSVGEILRIWGVLDRAAIELPTVTAVQDRKTVLLPLGEGRATAPERAARPTISSSTGKKTQTGRGDFRCMDGRSLSVMIERLFLWEKPLEGRTSDLMSEINNYGWDATASAFNRCRQIGIVVSLTSSLSSENIHDRVMVTC